MSKETIDGRTELIKIAEWGCKGNTEKVRQFMERFIIKYPNSELFKPFVSILKGDDNPNNLRMDYSQTQG